MRHVVQISFQPPHRRGGGSARQFFLLRELARDFEVTVIAPQDPGIPAGAVNELARFAHPVLFPLPTWSRNPARRALRLAQIIATPRPYASSAMDPLRAPIRAALTALPRAADVVYVEPSNVADWCALAPAEVPVVLGFHDLTFAALRERARHATAPARRIFEEVEWRKMGRTELRAAASADLNVMISALEERELKRLVPGARTVLAPNGVDTEYFRRPAVGRGTACGSPLLFLGSLNHPPNVDAARRMALDVLPALRADGIDVRLQIVGRSPVDAVLALDGVDGVEVVGEVDDVRPYLAAAAMLCAPIVFGGGVRMKLLDALAMGCAVVTTPKGAEGLDLHDGRQLRIAPIQRFAAAVRELLDDPAQAGRLGAAGRAFVEREHSWGACAHALARAIGDL